MRTFIFTLKHDKGRVDIEHKAEDIVTARKCVLMAEGAPASAIVKEKEVLFKVVKIGRKSQRRTVLERNLTEAQAQKVVKRYPNSERSMVIYARQ